VTFRSLADTSRRFRITCRIYRWLWQLLLLKRLYILNYLSSHCTLYRVIQEDRSVFWIVIISVIVRTKVHISMFIILNGYPGRTIWISRPNSVHFLFVELHEERSLRKKGGYMRRIAGWHFECCCLHKETWRFTQTNSTRSSYSSYRMHWGWRWDFRTFVLTCNRFFTYVLELQGALGLTVGFLNICFDL